MFWNATKNRFFTLIYRFAIPETEGDLTVHQSCCHILKSKVNVKWAMLPEDGKGARFGRVLLENIRLTDKMIENLELLPTTWDVSINNDNLKNLTDLILPIGKPIKLKLSLKSEFEFPVKGHMIVDFYIHEHKRTTAPTDSFVITQKESKLQLCQPSGVITHSTVILPLITGKFEIECCCKIQAEHSSEDKFGKIFSNVSKYPPILIAIT